MSFDPPSPTESPPAVRKVFICGNGKCRDRERAEQIYAHLQALVQAHRLDSFDSPYRVKCLISGCLDICENGVALVVQPDQVFYWRVDENNISRIFFEHLLDNQPVQDLIYRSPYQP